jgi:hypothetical protein
MNKPTSTRNKFEKALSSEPISQAVNESVDQMSSTTGRPKGKHSDDRYKQAGVWLPKDLITEVKIRLLREEKELSGLVEQLLREWVTR